MPAASVLLVERDPNLQSALDLFLHARGFLVTAASSVAEALRALLDRRHDAVVLGCAGDARPIAERLAGVPVVRLADAPHPRALLGALRALR